MDQNLELTSIRDLTRKGVGFKTRCYDPSEEGAVYPPGLDERGLRSVVKTLVMIGKLGPLCAIIPYSMRLHSRNLARQAGVSEVRMLPVSEMLDVCGYAVGAVSPFGFRTELPVFIDSIAAAFELIHVNAGANGIQLAVNPADGVQAFGWKVVDISRDDIPT